MRSLVIGGTLFIGRALVRKLLAKGHEVAVLHRKESHDLGPEVEGLRGDRNDAASVAAAVAGRRFDDVFDNVFDWERGTTGEQVEATARIFARTSIERYVFVSSVAAYGVRDEATVTPLTEDSPLAPDDHPDTYARWKAQSERALLRMHQQDGFPAVTLRPPFVYGPGNPYDRESFFWRRLQAGRPIIVPNQGERLMQFVHVEDFAECEVLAAENSRASGESFNVADPSSVTQLEFVRTLARVAGSEETVRIVPIPREQLLAAGGHARRRPYYFGQYLDLPPLPQDCSKLHRVLGFTPRNLECGFSHTYQEWKTASVMQSTQQEDFRFEDGVLSDF
jgi:nucleoside-diphosphate-sugar epimerase